MFWASQLNLQDWANVAAIGGGVGTVIAATVAIVAILQARHLQREQAQPYVAVFAENNKNVPEILELVIKNFGQTTAYNLEISFDSQPKISKWSPSDKIEPLFVPNLIPSLVPSQEWRTSWDDGSKRKDSELPHRHVVSVKYQGLKGQQVGPEYFIIDWEPLYSRIYMEEKTVHHLAKDMRLMRKELEKILRRPQSVANFFAGLATQKEKAQRSAPQPPAEVPEKRT